MDAFINSNSEFCVIGKKFWLYRQFMAKSNDNLCFLFVANISSFDATQKRISSNVPNVNCNHIAIQNTFFGIWKVAFFFKYTHYFRKHIMKTILWMKKKSMNQTETWACKKSIEQQSVHGKRVQFGWEANQQMDGNRIR